jgi:hypothetical protein
VSEHDPVRLKDPASGAPVELGALFEAAVRDLPSQAELASLSAKLAPLLGPSGAGGTGGATTGGLAAGAGKFAAVATALIGGAVLVASLTGEVPENVPAPAPIPAEEKRREPEQVGVPAPVVSEAAPPVESRSAVEDPPARTPRRSNAELEVDLLERARAALGSNPGHAYALTTEHKLRFPGGALAQEREIIAIDALKQLGRSDQAALRADQFAKNFPSSAHRYKLDAGAKR